MSLSALGSVGDAIDVTREFMTPVSVRRWATLALVVIFMGTPGTPVPANPQFLDPRLWQPPEPQQDEAATQEPVLDAPSTDALIPPLAEWPEWAFLVLAVVVAAAIVYVAVGVLMRFVFVESLRNDEVALLADGRANLGNTVRVLAFRVGLGLIGLVPVAIAAAAVTPLGPDPVSGRAAWLVGTLLGGTLALLWVIDAVTLQFVVPTMVEEGVGVLGGWRRLWPTLVEEWTEYLAFGVVRAILGAAVGIAAALVALVAIVLGAVLFVTVGAAIVLVAGGVGELSMVALGALLVVGFAFAVYALTAYAAVSVPFQIYLWSYALLVLGDTDEGLDLIPEFRARAREVDLPPA